MPRSSDRTARHGTKRDAAVRGGEKSVSRLITEELIHLMQRFAGYYFT